MTKNVCHETASLLVIAASVRGRVLWIPRLKLIFNCSLCLNLPAAIQLREKSCLLSLALKACEESLLIFLSVPTFLVVRWRNEHIFHTTAKDVRFLKTLQGYNVETRSRLRQDFGAASRDRTGVANSSCRDEECGALVDNG
jgi:hypothetical protein